MVKGVPGLDRKFRLPARADRDLFWHAGNVPKPARLTKSCIRAQDKADSQTIGIIKSNDVMSERSKELYATSARSVRALFPVPRDVVRLVDYLAHAGE